MTLKEKFGTFEAYQEYEAKRSLEYQKKEYDELRIAARHGNDYAVKYNISHSEVLQRLESSERAIKRLIKLIESNGTIKEPLYLMYWNKLKDKEWR